MADQAITALPKKTYSGSSQIASTDYLLGIDSAEGYQMLIQDLGEYIINRATASLAGSTQTLASAISALNSKLTLTGEYNYAESFSSAETLGSKLDELLNAQSSYGIGCYRLSCTASFGVFQNRYDYCVQMTRASSLSYVIAEFTPIDNGLIKILGKRRTEGWSFELAPTRAEMDNLRSSLGPIVKETASTAGSVTFTFTGNRYNAILMIQSNSFPSSGIYGLIFKKDSGSSIKSLVGNESLPTIDNNGSITINMASWSRAVLYTTSGNDFS